MLHDLKLLITMGLKPYQNCCNCFFHIVFPLFLLQDEESFIYHSRLMIIIKQKRHQKWRFLQMMIVDHGIKFGNITPPTTILRRSRNNKIQMCVSLLTNSCLQFYVSYAPFNYISHANNSRFSRFSNNEYLMQSL